MVFKLYYNGLIVLLSKVV